MNRALEIVVCFVACTVGVFANAESLVIAVLPDNYIVDEISVGTVEQVVTELQRRSTKKVAVSYEASTSIERLNALVTVLQKQGVKVGFIVSPLKP